MGAGQRLRLIDIGDDTVAEVTAAPTLWPTPWTPTTVFKASIYSDVEIQVIGTPSTAYIFQDSFDGVNFNDCYLLDRNGSMLIAATSAGRYRLPGNCSLRARQGAGSTFMIRAGN